jgi:hypothetical protein
VHRVLHSTGDALKKGRALLHWQAVGGGQDDLKLIVTEGEHRVTSSSVGLRLIGLVVKAVTGGLPLRGNEMDTRRRNLNLRGGNPVAIRVLF